MAAASQGVAMSRLPAPAGVPVTNFVLGGGGEPGRRHVEINRPRAKPPPQAAEAASENQEQRRKDNGEPPEPAPTGQPAPQRPQAIGKQVDLGIRSRQQPTRPT